MSDRYEEIGSVSFLVNEPRDQAFSEAEEQEIAALIAEKFSARLREQFPSDVIFVSGVETRRGCLIVTLNLSGDLIALGASLAAGVKVLTQYKDFRESVILAAGDLNKLCLKLRHRTAELRVWFYRHDLEYEQSRKRLDDEKT